MNKTDINIIKQKLETKQQIVIVHHKNPDGDALGSSLSLSMLLKKLGHQVNVISPNDYPEYIGWLPEADQICVFDTHRAVAEQLIAEATVIFTLDFNALHRVGEDLEVILSVKKAFFAMIDHHQNPDDYADYIFSDTQYGSTCQMIYHFAEQLNLLELLDKDIATCIYTGIVTDSGSFKFPRTTATLHRVVATLIDIGVDNVLIHNLLFDNSSYSRLKLLGRALEKMVILEDLQSAYIVLTKEDLEQCGYKKGDSEGMVNYPLTIKGINFSAFFMENDVESDVRISFRSLGDFDVNLFAQNFNGGGHKNAAGARSKLSLADTVEKFKEIVKKNNPKTQNV
ncbi:MAG: bifunctional oligoribonuclease/PAP phosphatase NrnA [Bacteroidota bacterium]|nr:bifunctional oligoribonuclease/PAP phosphatase NrnA [Bacteroidota bacterium]